MQVRPHLELTFENILSHINTIYVLKTKPGVMKVDAPPEYRYLRLKGQMLYVPETDLVIFLGYPSVMNLDDLTRLHIYSKTLHNCYIYCVKHYIKKCTFVIAKSTFTFFDKEHTFTIMYYQIFKRFFSMSLLFSSDLIGTLTFMDIYTNKLGSHTQRT